MKRNINWKDPQEVKEYKKQWATNNKKKSSNYCKKYYYNNLGYQKRRHAQYNRENPEKIAACIRKWGKKNPEKRKARNHANYNNFRKDYCLLHLLQGNKIQSIAFHHTDYESNMGFSVCRTHHKIVDKWIQKIAV